MTLRFKDLAVGELFEFARTGLYSSPSGPWKKISFKKYRHVDQEPHERDSVVGTVTVGVNRVNPHQLESAAGVLGARSGGVFQPGDHVAVEGLPGHPTGRVLVNVWSDIGAGTPGCATAIRLDSDQASSGVIIAWENSLKRV